MIGDCSDERNGTSDDLRDLSDSSSNSSSEEDSQIKKVRFIRNFNWTERTQAEEETRQEGEDPLNWFLIAKISSFFAFSSFLFS